MIETGLKDQKVAAIGEERWQFKQEYLSRLKTQVSILTEKCKPFTNTLSCIGPTKAMRMSTTEEKQLDRHDYAIAASSSREANASICGFPWKAQTFTS